MKEGCREPVPGVCHCLTPTRPPAGVKEGTCPLWTQPATMGAAAPPGATNRFVVRTVSSTSRPAMPDVTTTTCGWRDPLVHSRYMKCADVILCVCGRGQGMGGGGGVLDPFLADNDDDCDDRISEFVKQTLPKNSSVRS